MLFHRLWPFLELYPCVRNEERDEGFEEGDKDEDDVLDSGMNDDDEDGALRSVACRRVRVT